MKSFKDLAKKILQIDETPRLIHAIYDDGKYQYLESPMISDQAICPRCYGNKGIHCLIDPKISDQRMWFCVESNCLTYNSRLGREATRTSPKSQRSIQWPLFCENSGLGDVAHDISFESIQQSKSKMEFFGKFIESPKGLVIFQGTPGTGKSYAALGLCELFTRRSVSCEYITQKSLMDKWMNSFKGASSPQERLNHVDFLVIDEFGGKVPTPGFLEFFMDVLSHRLQWKSKGTILITNLNQDNMAEFCGDALSDRIKTGQYVLFTGETRRKAMII